MTDAGLFNKNTVYPYKKQLTREQFCELTYALYDKLTDDYISFGDKFIDTDNVSVLRLNAMGVINGKEINLYLMIK